MFYSVWKFKKCGITHQWLGESSKTLHDNICSHSCARQWSFDIPIHTICHFTHEGFVTLEKTRSLSDNIAHYVHTIQSPYCYNISSQHMSCPQNKSSGIHSLFAGQRYQLWHQNHTNKCTPGRNCIACQLISFLPRTAYLTIRDHDTLGLVNLGAGVPVTLYSLVLAGCMESPFDQQPTSGR